MKVVLKPLFKTIYIGKWELKRIIKSFFSKVGEYMFWNVTMQNKKKLVKYQIKFILQFG